jgi:hypothetical protein
VASRIAASCCIYITRLNDTYKSRNMDLSTTSFSDFFNGTFLKDQHFAGFRPNHFKTFYEMAIRGDIAKMAVTLSGTAFNSQTRLNMLMNLRM